MAAYKWKSGSRICGDAQAAGEAIEELRSGGGITTQALVDASRPKDAPLHGYFEWDDRKAAEQYRNVQAGHIIRSVEVVIEGTTEPTRAFVSVVTDGTRTYKGIGEVLASPVECRSLLDDALRDLESFRSKYSMLRELAGVFQAIDGIDEGKVS